MANFGKLTLTKEGMRLQALAEGGTQLKAKRMAMGSGNYSGNVANLTVLIKEEVSIAINNARLFDETSFKFEGYFENKDLQKGFDWRELGLFMEDPSNPEREILYCYSNAGSSSDFIPPATDERYDKYLTIQVGFNNAQNVTISVPESPLLIGREEFEEYKLSAKTSFNAHVEEFNIHKENKSNPHGVTKSQVGLGNVPNVATNDQTPTYTESSSLENITSGEKISISFGKIKKAISSLISHIGNKSNPHSVTKSQLGLGNVDNTSDANKPISTATQNALNDKLSMSAGGQVTGAVDFTSHTLLADGLLRSNTPVQKGYNGLQYFNIDAAETSGFNTAVPYGGQWYHIIRMNHQNSTGFFAEIAVPVNGYATDDVCNMYYRVCSEGKEPLPWRKLIDNYNSKNTTVNKSNYLNPTEIKANEDLNNFRADNKGCGFYFAPYSLDVQTLKNTPTNISFFMIVGAHNGTYQEIIEYTKDNPKRYYRNYYDGTWGSWYRTYSNADAAVMSEQISTLSEELEEKADKIAVLNVDGTQVVKKIDLGFKMLEEEGNVTKGQLLDRDTKEILHPETTIERVIGLDDILDGKAPSSHTHDDRYYTESEVDTKLNAKLNTTGNASNVTTSFLQSSTLSNLTAGEKLSTSLGKVMKAIADLISHIGNKSNPHSVTKSQVGLGNVDNTSDVNKPISTAVQTALNGKANSSHTHSYSQITGLTASRALVSDSSGKPAVSAVTATELGYLDGVTGNVQTQLNGKSVIKDGSGNVISSGNMTPQPNIFDNADFASGIINERGLTTYTSVANSWGKTYSIDRWWIQHGAKVELLTNKIKISNTHTSESSYFRQNLGKLNGYHTIAINVLSKNGKITTTLNGGENIELSVGLNIITRNLNGSITTFGINLDSYSASNCYVEIDFIKLEEGNAFTGMPVWNRPLELLKCQRKYQTIRWKERVYLAQSGSSVTYEKSLPLPTEMDKTPTITVGGSGVSLRSYTVYPNDQILNARYYPTGNGGGFYDIDITFKCDSEDY